MGLQSVVCSVFPIVEVHMACQPTVADELAPLSVFRPSVLGHVETLLLHLQRLRPRLSELEARRLGRAEAALAALSQGHTWRELKAALIGFGPSFLAPLEHVLAQEPHTGGMAAPAGLGYRKARHAYAALTRLVDAMLRIDEDCA